jgi:hypothetical protein
MTTPEQFNRLSISVRDFEQAVAYAEQAAKVSRNTLEYQALLFSAIVSYYRPFSPNERKATALASSQLNIADFGALTTADLALHERCKVLRNKALAHSEYELNPTALDETSGVISSRPFDLFAHAPDHMDLIALARKLATTCHHWRADHIYHPSGGKSAA